MSEEEKKAIENLKERIKYLEKHMKNYKKIDCKTAFYEVLQTEKESLEIVLNLIQKQQKDIDLNNEAEIALNNRIIDLEVALKKKDKIINEMIAEIYKRTHIKTKECSFYVDEDKCLKYSSCTACIFEYFKNLAEKVK